MVTDEDTDTTKVAEHVPVKPPVEYSAWMELRPRIARELLDLATAGSLPTGAALKRVCHRLFGVDCSPHDETRFRIFAAPIARKTPSAWRTAATALATATSKSRTWSSGSAGWTLRRCAPR
jgi:hypothetical protein